MKFLSFKLSNQFPLLLLISCLILPIKSFEFLDYTQEHLYDCSQEGNPPPGVLILHEIDRYMYISICPITIIATSLIILTFFKYPGTRNSPGDLLLAISLCEFALNVHWLISSIYSVARGGEAPLSRGDFCIFNSIFSIPTGILDFAYNFLLNWYVSSALKHSLKGYSPNTKMWHWLMVICAVGILLGFEFGGQSGLSIFGTCSYTSNKLIYVSGPLIGFLYLFLGMYMRRQFTKSLPDPKHRAHNKRAEFSIYFKYIAITSVIYMLFGLTNLIVGLNCYTFHNPGLNLFLTVTNFLKLLSPFLLSLLRFRDPILRKKVAMLLQPVKGLQFGIPFIAHLNSSNSENKQQQQENNNDNSMTQQQFLNNSNDLDRPGSQRRFKDLAEYNLFLRQMSLKLMLEGINGHFSMESDIKTKISELTDEDYLERDESLLESDMIDAHQEWLSLRMTAHSPIVMKYLRDKDRADINCSESTRVALNEDAIKNASGKGEGGAGGEFFFFTSDNQLLMKTINSTELEILLSKLQKFVQYFENEPLSFIARIYGIFTFQQQSALGTQEHLIVMKHIANGFDNFYIERKYDLKGSSHNRYVDTNNKNIKDLVLKDLNFDEEEQKIHSNQQRLNEVSQILEFDCNFLSGCGFMDYSLLVLKVNMGNYMEGINDNNNPDNIESQQPPQNNIDMQAIMRNCPSSYSRLQPFVNAQDPNLVYFLGIIDYLQQWTVKKSLERAWKNCMHGRNINTSAQPPRVYADRFKQYIRKIFS